MNIGSLVRWTLTLCVVALAAAFVYVRYHAYFQNPWTRDGLVQAEVIEIAPRVSGPVGAVHVVANQFVRKGDPLFEVDAATYAVAEKRAGAELRRQRSLTLEARQTAERNERLWAEEPGAISAQTLRNSRDALEAAEADEAAAAAAFEAARLDLQFTRITAPADGYVVNPTVQPGSMAVAYQPMLALIREDTFWVDAFFRETIIADFNPGDEALVTLMSYPDRPLRGRVESIGRGIARQDGSTGEKLLPSVSPTFEWIRLAQRIPVRVRLEDVPSSIQLRMGTTASVLVRVDSKSGSILPLPSLLQ